MGKCTSQIEKLKVKDSLNKSIDNSGDQPFLTPLYFCYPNIELAKSMRANGADPDLLSFLHCFFTYRNSAKFLSSKTSIE